MNAPATAVAKPAPAPPVEAAPAPAQPAEAPAAAATPPVEATPPDYGPPPPPGFVVAGTTNPHAGALRKARAWHPPIAAHPPKPEEELTPEEIVRRKLAYEEYLQQNGLQPIGEALQNMKADGTSSEPPPARGKPGARVQKPDAPVP